MNMSINQVQNYFNATRIEQPRALSREERIKNNDKEIAKLENEITLRQENIKDTENLISSNNKTIEITKQIKANNDKLLGLHNGQRGLLLEARDLAIEARDAAVKVYDATSKVYDATTKSRDLLQKMMEVGEKMEAIMMKNPAKYENMTWAEFKNRSEIKEAKAQVIQLANVIVEQYPKEESVALTDTVKNVVDATFTEIKPTDVKANMKLFNNLEKRIEAALDKKYETLALRDQGIKPIVNAHYKSVEQFSRIKKLDYLDLALKNIKV